MASYRSGPSARKAFHYLVYLANRYTTAKSPGKSAAGCGLPGGFLRSVRLVGRVASAKN